MVNHTSKRFPSQKSCIRKTMNLLPCVESRTDTIHNYFHNLHLPTPSPPTRQKYLTVNKNIFPKGLVNPVYTTVPTLQGWPTIILNWKRKWYFSYTLDYNIDITLVNKDIQIEDRPNILQHLTLLLLFLPQNNPKPREGIQRVNIMVHKVLEAYG